MNLDNGLLPKHLLQLVLQLQIFLGRKVLKTLLQDSILFQYVGLKKMVVILQQMQRQVLIIHHEQEVII